MSTVQALPLYINDYAKPVSTVTAEQTVIGPGLGSIIAQFMWTVCDEGEGVLLTTVSFRLQHYFKATRFTITLSDSLSMV